MRMRWIVPIHSDPQKSAEIELSSRPAIRFLCRTIIVALCQGGHIWRRSRRRRRRQRHLWPFSDVMTPADVTRLPWPLQAWQQDIELAVVAVLRGRPQNGCCLRCVSPIASYRHSWMLWVWMQSSGGVKTTQWLWPSRVTWSQDCLSE